MTYPVGNQNYSLANGSNSTAVFITFFAPRAPTVNDVQFPVAKRWVNTVTAKEYILTGFNVIVGVRQAVWINLTNGAVGAVDELSGNTGTNPVNADGSGNIGVRGDGTSINISGDGVHTLTASTILPSTANVVLIGETTSISSVAPASAGLVLTSNGASAPTWQAASGSSGIVTIDGDSGSVTGSTVTIEAGISTQNCGSTVEFTSSGTTLSLSVTSAGNTIIGQFAGNSAISGSINTSLGKFNLGSLIAGTANSCLGDSCLENIIGGNYNLTLGQGSGNGYTGNESANILLQNNGILGESNTLRIGSGTGTGTQELSQAFIAGINGNTSSSPMMVTINSTTDQLGVAPIPSTGTVWLVESSNFTAASGNGYFIVSTLSVQMPSTVAIGDTISFAVTAGIATINVNTGDRITIGGQTTGGSGSIINTANGDSLTLVYNPSLAGSWVCIGAPQGVWTLN